MESTSIASEEPFALEINPNALYNRIWMIQNIPGMHKNRISTLQAKFGLLPLNSGNREAFFVYRGARILDALEKEAYARMGLAEDDVDE